MKLSTLADWLSYIDSLHEKKIDLGLDRVKEVASHLKVLYPKHPVIIVGGTNGKGSTVASLEQIYLAAGYRVGAFTSPMLFKINEQIRINGVPITDGELITAFTQVEEKRKNVSLTPFEFLTLAALFIFKTQKLSVLLLEVGLGGRLDAVNILDADLAIITTIALDHTEWLGETQDAIGFEKAGIFRKYQIGISGDFATPDSILTEAKKLDVKLYLQGLDFNYEEHEKDWTWRFENTVYEHLPKNALALQNLSTTLMAITTLQATLPVTLTSIKQGLSQIVLPGRQQIIPGPITYIYDVSHNPASVLLLANTLQEHPCYGKTLGVFSMLKDKDIDSSLKMIKDAIDDWYIAPLQTKRAASIEELSSAFHDQDIDSLHTFSNLAEAFLAAKKAANTGDRIVVFGSFHAVSEILSLTL